MDATPPLSPAPVPPPLATVPVFSAQDADHLRMLAIAHYVVGALIALFSLIFIIHIVLGITALTGNLPLNSGGQPSSPTEERLFGWMFTIVGCVIVFGGVTLGAFVAYAGRCLTRRRRYLLCLIVAGLACLFTPIGTALGVFSLITLLRPQVKAAFDLPATTA
ncbi:hypothetical protein JY420_05650 [Stenotrophomonas maltophilia]|uniref:Transmembrane protein n=1 Tax=Stenotrophomonas maltophilia TaxID=40324 RepID=A0AA40XYZ2_STEMA|nr:hypothetical protein [Stenotrophomonas geniculata]MBH1641021.1 hypothetical protein [Stenotrophomonas maltophilia]MBN5129966.1 hypothetical protein [Stenotrophomonas maltophilia]MBN5133657.1 hypothetical protein [Stenotrophomonas maltophilia]MCI1118457.1 hypothetical protein [Stenotrophomonas maltophilia]